MSHTRLLFSMDLPLLANTEDRAAWASLFDNLAKLVRAGDFKHASRIHGEKDVDDDWVITVDTTTSEKFKL